MKLAHDNNVGAVIGEIDDVWSHQQRFEIVEAAFSGVLAE